MMGYYTNLYAEDLVNKAIDLVHYQERLGFGADLDEPAFWAL